MSGPVGPGGVGIDDLDGAEVDELYGAGPVVKSRGAVAEAPPEGGAEAKADGGGGAAGGGGAGAEGITSNIVNAILDGFFTTDRSSTPSKTNLIPSKFPEGSFGVNDI